VPILTRGNLHVDYTDEGQGQPVLLVHSSASGNRQWRALAADLKDRYRVLAVNLYGYGKTTVWPGAGSQSLYAQAQLVLALAEQLDRPIHLVGHSFGGAVALRAALLLGAKVEKLALFEPNPFHLLKQHGPMEVYLETQEMLHHVKCYGALREWAQVAQRFADYWSGDHAWARLPDERRAAFAAAIIPSLYEAEALSAEDTTVDEYRKIAARTLLMYAAHTRPPVYAIVDIFARECPHWTITRVAEGGHMAPLTRPDVVNPLISAFLDSRDPPVQP